MDLALNNQQRLICHKTQQTKPNLYLIEKKNKKKKRVFYPIEKYNSVLGEVTLVGKHSSQTFPVVG